MGAIKNALAWSGSNVTLSMFAVAPPETTPVIDLSHGAYQPTRTRRYDLEDADGVLGGRRVFEFDAVFVAVPDDLTGYLVTCLRRALGSGAEAAWFGFEGSFDFGFLLAPEIADQVYAVADATGIAVADDDALASDEWKTQVAKARARLLRKPPTAGLPA